jgi:hypothetical protein
VLPDITFIDPNAVMVPVLFTEPSEAKAILSSLYSLDRSVLPDITFIDAIAVMVPVLHITFIDPTAVMVPVLHITFIDPTAVMVPVLFPEPSEAKAILSSLL